MAIATLMNRFLRRFLSLNACLLHKLGVLVQGTFCGGASENIPRSTWRDNPPGTGVGRPCWAGLHLQVNPLIYLRR